MTDKSAAAIREFAEKIVPVIINSTVLCNTEEIIEAFTGDLTALIEEHYYPKEFIKWKDTRYHCVAGLYLEKQPEGSDKTFRQIPHFTLDELYQYWEENVK